MSFEIVFVAVFVAMLLILSGVYFYKKFKNPNVIGHTEDKKGKTSILRTIERICFFKGYKVVKDVVLEADKGDVPIDAVMIGPFGIVAVEVYFCRNQVYAHQNDIKWVHISGGKKEYIDNLYKKGAVQKNAIRRLLSKNGIYNIEIGGICVFDGPKLELYAPKDLPAVTLSGLKKELKKPFYKRETNINIERVYSLFKELK